MHQWSYMFVSIMLIPAGSVALSSLVLLPPLQTFQGFLILYNISSYQTAARLTPLR
jgi:hypothetical protein